DGARRLPEQRGQRVARLHEADLELRDGGARALQLRRRLRRIELRGGAVLETRLGDLERLFLQGGVVPGQVDQHLLRADRDVRARDLGGQRDQRVVVVGDGRQHVGGLRL